MDDDVPADWDPAAAFLRLSAIPLRWVAARSPVPTVRRECRRHFGVVLALCDVW